MEWLYPIALRIIAAVALIYFGLGLFNVHWLMRVRILASLAAGALIISAAGFPLLRHEDPLGAISLFTGQISVTNAGLVVVLGFLAGIVATLLCYPIGNILGPYAAPAGIAVLALCTGSIKQLLLTNSALEQRNTLYGFFRLESIFWLAVCTAGYTAVFLTTKLIHTKAIVIRQQSSHNDEKKMNLLINILIAIAATAVIVYLTIGIFAQDIRQIDEKLGSVIGTPGNKQIAFGVFVSVGLAAFVVKRFLQIHFIPAILGAVALYIVMLTKIIGSDDLSHMVKTWPVDFFPYAIYATTPIQFVSFSVLGAMTGYWIAIRTLQGPSEE